MMLFVCVPEGIKFYEPRGAVPWRHGPKEMGKLLGETMGESMKIEMHNDLLYVYTYQIW